MRILIISEYIAPAGAIASIRWTKLGKYLAAEHGCTVDVLTNQKNLQGNCPGAPDYPYDETLAGDMAFFNEFHELRLNKPLSVLVRLHRLLRKFRRPPNPSNHNTKTGSAQPRNPEDVQQSLVERLLSVYLGRLENAWARAWEKAKLPLSEYDVVISTCGPQWCHLIAEQIKARKPELVWLADYRDPLTGYVSRMTANNMEFARRHTSSADAIIAVADGIVEHLYLPAGQKCVVIHNGYDDSEIQKRERKAASKFILSHTGCLYNEPPNVRDMTPLFKVLESLIAEGEISASDVEVAYCGSTSSEFLSQAANYPLVPIRDLGLVPRSDALKLQDHSSILVFCTWNTPYSKGALTGKLYEYLSAAVPMAALCSGPLPNHESTDIVQKSNAGFAYEEASSYDDFPKLRTYVLQAYRQWKNQGMTECHPNWDYIQSFEYKNLTNELFSLIRSLQSG